MEPLRIVTFTMQSIDKQPALTQVTDIWTSTKLADSVPVCPTILPATQILRTTLVRIIPFRDSVDATADRTEPSLPFHGEIDGNVNHTDSRTASSLHEDSAFGHNSPIGETDPTPIDPDDAQQLIVLVDGTVLNGPVEPVPGGYAIEYGNTRSVLPEYQVQVTAINLPDAYVKLRSQFVRPRASDHVSLARWCMKNELTLEARRELADALRLEPQRPDARELLRELELQISNAPIHLESQSSVARTSDSFIADPPRRIGRYFVGIDEDVRAPDSAAGDAWLWKRQLPWSGCRASIHDRVFSHGEPRRGPNETCPTS